MDLSSGITRLSISNDLPDEIWQLIFHEAVTVPAETIPILHGVWWLQWLISPYTLTYWPGKPWKLSLSTRLTITLVCRRWYSIGIAFLYRTIYLAQGEPRTALLQQFQQNEVIRSLVRRLEDSPYDNSETIDLDSFPNLIFYFGNHNSTSTLSSSHVVQNLRYLHIKIYSIEQLIQLFQILAGSPSLEILNLYTSLSNARDYAEEVPFTALELPYVTAVRMYYHVSAYAAVGRQVGLIEVIPRLRFPRLKSLEIDRRRGGPGGIGSPPWLTQLENLTLTISGDHNLYQVLETPFVCLQRIVLIVETVKSVELLAHIFHNSHLQTITHIYFDFRSSWLSGWWEELKPPLEAAVEMLLDRTQFSTLKSVNVSYFDEATLLHKDSVIARYMLELDGRLGKVGVTLDTWREGEAFIPFIDIIPDEVKTAPLDNVAAIDSLSKSKNGLGTTGSHRISSNHRE